MVTTVTLVGCRVQLLYFSTGLPQQLFVLENEKSGDLLIPVSLLKKMDSYLQALQQLCELF